MGGLRILKYTLIWYQRYQESGSKERSYKFYDHKFNQNHDNLCKVYHNIPSISNKKENIYNSMIQYRYSVYKYSYKLYAIFKFADRDTLTRKIE